MPWHSFADLVPDIYSQSTFTIMHTSFKTFKSQLLPLQKEYFTMSAFWWPKAKHLIKSTLPVFSNGCVGKCVFWPTCTFSIVRKFISLLGELVLTSSIGEEIWWRNNLEGKFTYLIYVSLHELELLATHCPQHCWNHDDLAPSHRLSWDGYHQGKTVRNSLPLCLGWIWNSRFPPCISSVFRCSNTTPTHHIRPVCMQYPQRRSSKTHDQYLSMFIEHVGTIYKWKIPGSVSCFTTFCSVRCECDACARGDICLVGKQTSFRPHKSTY